MDNVVKSARRALEILELLSTCNRALTLNDVAKILVFPKSSTHMLIATLEQCGYVVRDDGNRFMLSPGLREGGTWIGGIPGRVYRAAQPEMDKLLKLLDETTVFGMVTPGLDIRIVSHRTSRQAIRYDVSQDPLLPGYCTAMGHAILCHLPGEEVRTYLASTSLTAMTAMTLTDPDAILARLEQCRAQGYATNIDERFEGAAGVAVAIVDPGGRPHAALDIATVTPRFHRQRDQIVRALIESARAIERTAFGSLAGAEAERGAPT